MAHGSLHRLNPKTLLKLPAGIHCDGGKLYLQVTETPAGSIARSWLYRYRAHPGGIGLGSLDSVTAAMARAEAQRCREWEAAGLDPLTERERERARKKSALAKLQPFKEFAEEAIDHYRTAWTDNGRSEESWRNSLKNHAYPIIGNRPVDIIDRAAVIEVLAPIWLTKRTTANNIRGRLERIMGRAIAAGVHPGPNPAVRDKVLFELLPQRRKRHRVNHHPALPYPEMPEFMARVRQRLGSSPRALEWAILTATRTNETIGARLSEIDEPNRVWTVPPERMGKNGLPHRVPLSDRCMEIIEEQKKAGATDYLFPGREFGMPLSNMAMLMLLRGMGHTDITTHGTARSSFRDWAADRTNFPREVAEAALAHVNDDKTEAAYLRTAFFEKRQ
ncbi:MAG TPA: integrase arm-type DNA-binding domain-containing protein, partial [Stellaceae bacterium]|nr:integrase arm-type DNA-binding domain-containing protein [Stellaceae bacterium]